MATVLFRCRRRVALTLSIAGVLAVSGATPAAAAASGGWWNLGQGATAGSDPLNGRVFAMTRAGSDLYLGGDFTNAGGKPAADYVARWTGSAWKPVGAGITNGHVNAVAVDGGRVIVGGAFNDAGGDLDADNLAMWNGSAWQALSDEPIGTVFALAIIGRTLYVGGAFDNADAIPEADGIAAYGLDSGAWSAITDGNEDVGGTVHAMVPDGSGGLFLGGTFTNVDGIEAADHVVQWTGGTNWMALGAPAQITGFVRGLARSGSDLYVVGDFINAAGLDAADKVARWDGSWHALGSSSFMGESNQTLYGVAADGTRVFIVGSFVDGGGNVRADSVAGFDGTAWRNVGTNANGSNGPAVALRTAAVVGARLYVGGIDTAIGGGTQHVGAAFHRLRQPDGRIKTTGAFLGNDRYNRDAAGQTRSLSRNQGATATFTVAIANDGWAVDSVKVRATGSGGGFTATYTMGAVNVTGPIVAGTLTLADLPRGASRTIVVKVKVGNGVANGASRAFRVTATSTGPGGPKDVVKAVVKAT